MEGGAWWATVHGVAKSRTRLSEFTSLHTYPDGFMGFSQDSNPKDGSPPGSPVPGILQVRTLEWVAISFHVHESEK